MPTEVPAKRALLSVSNKSGLVELGVGLADRGIELVSTGGTAVALREAGLVVQDVSELTGYPEMMDGRVKTLHPGVHGGLLALRDNAEHVTAMDKHGIFAIDILVVNLYPFEATVAAGSNYKSCIESIDIGGPAMIRAAAKNHGFVSVVVDAEDYDGLLSELDANNCATSLEYRKAMAQRAFARTAAYDSAVSNWLADAININFPRHRVVAGTLQQTMRYGENPHQSAAYYSDGSGGLAMAQQLQGKELSYNNINDTDAALELVAEFDDLPACAIIKHANPCGVATGATLADAYARAFDCDRTSAFGGIVALNRELDENTAAAITEIFTEVVIAPGATKAAQQLFAKKANLRLLLIDELPDPARTGIMIKQVSGGYLVQDRDSGQIDANNLKTVTKRTPSDDEMADMLMAWKVAKHVKSNAIIYVKDGAAVGIGAGQMSRIDSTVIAARKSREMAENLKLSPPLTQGSVVASDAFFPFADGLLAAAEAGATAIIQPGGSVRDDEVIAAADEAGLAMVFTGMRHFRH